MKLVTLEDEVVRYIPRAWRGQEDAPIFTLRVLRGREIERLAVAHATSGWEAGMDALIKAAVIKIENLEDERSSPIVDGEGLVKVIPKLSPEVYRALVEDVALALRSHSSLSEGVIKNSDGP